MIIKGTNYRIPEISFRQVCALEEAGISLFDVMQPKKKFMSIVNAFTAIAMNIDVDDAYDVIQEHLIEGGTMDGWIEEILESVEKSSFFQAMTAKQPEKKPAKK